MRKEKKYVQWLKVESIRFETSKATGNNMLVVDFRDSQNVLYRHFISNNKKSQVWLKQLFAGLKPVTFEELEVSCFVGALATIDFQKYYNFAVGKVYETVTVRNSDWADKRIIVVPEIYARHLPGFNYQKALENFEKNVKIEKFF